MRDLPIPQGETCLCCFRHNWCMQTKVITVSTGTKCLLTPMDFIHQDTPEEREAKNK